MGVLVCDRRNCDNIMCDDLICGMYVCYECLGEFRDRNRHLENVQFSEFHDLFREFMKTPKKDYRCSDGSVDEWISSYRPTKDENED